jgi:predicted Fe-S protein YdhL (DUF1289 family)
MTSAIDSPCTKVCTLHPRLNICVGCGRTLAEIERWPALSSQERIGLMTLISERLERLRATNWAKLD